MIQILLTIFALDNRRWQVVLNLGCNEEGHLRDNTINTLIVTDRHVTVEIADCLFSGVYLLYLPYVGTNETAVNLRRYSCRYLDLVPTLKWLLLPVLGF